MWPSTLGIALITKYIYIIYLDVKIYRGRPDEFWVDAASRGAGGAQAPPAVEAGQDGAGLADAPNRNSLAAIRSGRA
jgi:hypothetical protein